MGILITNKTLYTLFFANDEVIVAGYQDDAC